MDKTGDIELNYCYNCMTRLDSGQTVCPECGHYNTLHQNPEDALPEGTILAGKYLVGKVLGQGGFGITYLGFDTALKLRVAIKEYFPSGIGVRSPHSIRVTAMSSQAKAENFRKGCDEFQSEAERLAQIDSPNIVKVRDYFRENGTAYIVMSYLEGNSLTKEVAECGGRMPWQRVIALFKPLISEIEKLHKEQLIHRDIKPDNIKVVKDKDGTERMVLLDFGAARSFVSAEVTGTYTAMLTPGYAPIEQYSRKARQGPYTDIYALCATMYSVLTGILPAAASDRMTGEAEIRTFGEMGIDMPTHIAEAIFHGLEVRSVDRPQSMQELYDELCGEAPVLNKRPAIPVKTAPNPLKEERKKNTEDPESKKKINWLLPVLFAVLLAAGFFFYRGIRQNQMNKAGIQNSGATMYEQTAAALEMTRAANHVMETEASFAETQLAIEMRMADVAATKTKGAEPTSTSTPEPTATPTVTNTPEPTATPTKRPLSVGDIITLGYYEQDNNRNNGAEAIEWQVLAVENGRALVISKYGLDAKKYNEKEASVAWEKSTLRAWLNGEFYNRAFSSEEKGYIKEIRLINPNNAAYGTNGGNDTTDRIFLLSIEEANRYFVNNEARQCQPTIYAKNNKAFAGNKNAGMTWWWLRSPGHSGSSAAIVRTDGGVYNDGFKVNSTDTAVRPAFWLDLTEKAESAAAMGTESIFTKTPEPTVAAKSGFEIGSVKTGDIITLGHYEQDNNRNNGAETIEWRVLAVEDGRALLISRYGLDAKKYNETDSNVTWEKSTLRAWLNGEFYNRAFSSAEKARIQEVRLINPNNAAFGTKGGNDTKDRIFLLSIDEANRYLRNNEARQCQPTIYAKNNKAFTGKTNAGMTWWWLRSPGHSGSSAAIVRTDGGVYNDGFKVNSTDTAVRPAFWLDLYSLSAALEIMNDQFEIEPEMSFISPEPNGSLKSENPEIIWTDPGINTTRFHVEIFNKAGSILFRADLSREQAWCDGQRCTLEFRSIPAGNYRIVLISYSESDFEGQQIELTFNMEK